VDENKHSLFVTFNQNLRAHVSQPVILSASSEPMIVYVVDHPSIDVNANISYQMCTHLVFNYFVNAAVIEDNITSE